MYWSEFQLASQAVQLKYRLYEAKRDGTPNELPPSREIYVKGIYRFISNFFLKNEHKTIDRSKKIVRMKPKVSTMQRF